MTARERSGWRDQEISARHRRWGFNCPAVDLDFLMVEYHLAVPVAVVEYKHHRNHEGDKINLNHATYRALAALADIGALPFLIVRYWPDTWAMRVLAANNHAQRWLGEDWRSMSEQQYVTGLYRLRNLVAEESLLRNLNTDLPPRLKAAS